MGLKQSIVVRSEYTVKNKSGKGGSRGGTPGEYILRYMSRDNATETVAPVKLFDADEYVARYMARESATEMAESPSDVRHKIKAGDKFGGRAFGYGSASLSHERLIYACNDIQKQFDNGKTVFKTILSFTDEYLKENGIVDHTFELERAGDYAGQVDQLKLRLSIMNGLDKMAKNGFSDLQYVGAIQVDTEHVHCHLAMVDRGKGRVIKEGSQRGAQKGKLTAYDMKTLRRGIDASLDTDKSIQFMSSDVALDKRNAVSFVKRHTHATMRDNSLSQFLMACLPEDRNLWRANTNRREMRKPNAVVKQYVTEVLNQPDSGYEHALSSIVKYADERKSRDNLSAKEYRKLIDDGKSGIVEGCMNGVYSTLKQIPKERFSTSTPMLSAMSMDYVDMSTQLKDDPMVEFGFKLRSYSSRLQHHKKERHVYHDIRKSYEAASESGNVSPESKPLYDFFKFEEEYNAQLMSKYQHFLAFLPLEGEYADEFEALNQYKTRMERLQLMSVDPSMKRMKPEIAEAYGVKAYDQRGGQFVKSAPWILEGRLDKMHDRYAGMVDDFRVKLADYGMSYDGSEVLSERPHKFDDVKALDLHHLGYDFMTDTPISRNNTSNFVTAANERYELWKGAVTYLTKSGQDAMLKALPSKDVKFMKEMADSISRTSTLPSSVAIDDSGKHRKAVTVPLDMDCRTDMELVVKAVVNSVATMEREVD